MIINGHWQLAQYPTDVPDKALFLDGLNWIAATVPGAVQYDLMSHGLLSNPYASTKNAFDAAWVAKSDWLYKCNFTISELSREGHWVLKVNGVDTYGEVWIDNTFLGEVCNNYRSYEMQVPAEALKYGENTLYIRVKAHDRMMKGVKEAEELLDRRDGVEGLQGKSLIRRYQRSFFTNSSLLNIGTGVLGIGINRPVELCFYSGAYVSDCFFRTTSISANMAKGEVHVKINGAEDKAITTCISIYDNDGEIVSYSAQSRNDSVYVSIPSPKLWWPVGYGEPYLYDLVVQLKVNGSCVHEIKQKIGIRLIQLEQDGTANRETFQFRINGKPIYVRGQNFIPLDYIKVYGSKEDYTRFFKLLKNANTNLLRIWGGGMPESEDFFNMCDSMGILVWQDCFMHSNVYPDYDPEFVKEILDESTEIIINARKHACLAIICGGNEQIEGWEEWGWSFDLARFYGRKILDKLALLSKGLCPDLPFVENSPHGGKYAQSPIKGDCHNWGSYFNAFKDPLFVTETCWTHESYSRPDTLKKFMDLDVDEYTGKGWFEKFSARTSLQPQNRQPYSNWFNRGTLRDYLISMEIEQMRADYSALSIFRLRSPSNRGIVYWSFNKGGPLFQFGCVDYGGEPMMSYYVVRRLFQQVVIGVYRDIDDIHVVLSNESGALFEGSVELFHYRADGKIISHNQKKVKATDGSRSRSLSLINGYQAVSDRSKEVFFVRLFDKQSNIISEDILYLCPFSEFCQDKAPIKVEIVGNDIVLECDGVLQLVEIKSNHKIMLSDNYFPLAPGHKKTIKVDVLQQISNEPITFTVSNIVQL